MKTLVFVFVLFANAFLQAQSNSEKADRYFDQNMFTNAIKLYEPEIKSRNKKTQEHAMKRLADCYRITGQFELAEELYRKIIKKYRKDPINYLNYGLSLKSSAKYEEAKQQFAAYINSAPNDPMGQVYLSSCDSAQLWLDQTLGKEVKNMVSINTDQSDFSPVLLPNRKVLFCSARHGSKQAFVSLNGGNDQTKLDLYIAELDQIKSSAAIKTPLARVKPLNTPAHEGSACLSVDNKQIYFTKTVKGKKNKFKNSIVSTLQIYVADLDSEGNWQNIRSAFDFNSFEYSVAHPSLSNDGKTLFFMSDMPGGFGKSDIYYSIKDSNNVWQKPINAGSEVNTFGYELFPYISSNNTLYFSSNAHEGMGQLDIFSANFIQGKYRNVHNLKPPINSIGNDFGISIDAVTGYGLFSSDRFNGRGAEDVYAFSIEKPIVLELHNDTLYIADLRLFDDISYTIQNDSTKQTIEWQNSNGNFFTQLSTNTKYKLIIKKHGLKFAEIETTIECSNTLNTKTFTFNCYPKKTEVLLRGYYFCDNVNDSIVPRLPEWQDLQVEQTNMQLSKQNVFRYQAFLKSEAEFKITSDDPNKRY